MLFNKRKLGFQKLIYCDVTDKNVINEVRRKLSILNCKVLKTERHRKFKFDENVFQAFCNILVKIEILALNALSNLHRNACGITWLFDITVWELKQISLEIQIHHGSSIYYQLLKVLSLTPSSCVIS